MGQSNNLFKGEKGERKVQRREKQETEISVVSYVKSG